MIAIHERPAVPDAKSQPANGQAADVKPDHHLEAWMRNADDEARRWADELGLDVMRDVTGRLQVLISSICRKNIEIKICVAPSKGGPIVTAGTWFNGFPNSRRCLSLLAEDVETFCMALKTARAVIHQLGRAARRTDLEGNPKQQHFVPADAEAEIDSTK
jgi:hypothetical protein